MEMTLTLPASTLRPLLPDLLRHAAAALSEQQPAAVFPAITTSTETPPRIGERWPSQGGIYAGICRGVDGSADHHLILCEAKPVSNELSWQAALDWAAVLSAAGHADWSLPTRAESSVLFGNLRDQFDPVWHWTSEQYSAFYAWVQNFSDGSQLYNDKGDEGRARAVRRFKLNP